MIKQLVKAYNECMIGTFRPELLALNSKEWEGELKERYVMYEKDYRTISTNPPIDLETETPKWVYFKYAVLLFKPNIPIGEVWIWRLEPTIMFRSYDLSDGQSLLRINFVIGSTLNEEDVALLDISSGKRLQGNLNTV